MSQDLQTRRKRALWRASHRGTKELDMIVGGYGAAHIATMSADVLGVFEDLLETAEPKLQVWLLAPTMASDVTPEFRALVREIRAFHGLADVAGEPAAPTRISPES